MTKVTIKKDLLTQFGPVRDQRNRPTCLAFAASDCHAGLRHPWWPLSCEYIFFHAQRRAGNPPTMGATLSSMLEALRLDGQPRESGWPYLQIAPSDASIWTPPRSVGPLFGRQSTPVGHTIDAVIDQLELGHPVLLLTILSASFFSAGSHGIVDPPAKELPEPSQRHAVVAVAHGVTGGQRAIFVRNSWGSGWGLGGYGWLTESFLTPRLFAAAILMEEVDVSAGPTTT